MDNLSLSLKRIRTQTDETSDAIYEGRCITALLLRQPNSLCFEEREILKSYYIKNGKEQLLKIGKGKKIIPFVAEMFIELGLDKQFWGAHYNFYLNRNIKIKNLLDSIFKELKARGCKSVVLTENFGVLLASNSGMASFCSGDVDLSADITEQNIIVSTLNLFGFHSKDQPSNIGEYTGQSMQFFSGDAIDGGFWVNVIWKPVTRAFLVQDKYEVRLRNKRIEAQQHNGSNIKILDDTSLLYFCALHSSAGHYYTLSPGLRLFVDIDRMARKSNIDWNKILNWEIQDKAGIRISMALYLANKVLKTPVPSEFMSRVESRSANIRLFRYLYDNKKNSIQSKTSRLRRLYVELASDNLILPINFVRRIFIYFWSKFKANLNFIS
jgi:hypothetical protein